jgi:predicted DNA-binding transcriptional regulator AlpA
MDDDRMWSARECWEFFGVGQTHFYELCAEPDFPASVKLGKRATRWFASEIKAYASARRVHRAHEETAPAAGLLSFVASVPGRRAA